MLDDAISFDAGLDWRPQTYMPDGVIALEPDVVFSAHDWRKDIRQWRLNTDTVFGLSLSADAVRSVQASTSDILFQIKLRNAVFSTSPEVRVVLSVGGVSLPAMTLLVDRQQTMSACLIPLSLWGREGAELSVRLVLPDGGTLPESLGVYSLYAVDRPVFERSMTSKLVWLFSIARSGTTWLGEIFWSLGDVAVIDEPALPRMLGILEWDPEYVFGGLKDFWRDNPFKSHVRGTEFGTDIPPGRESAVFSRQLAAKSMERNAIWAPHSLALLQQVFVSAICEQVVREYGVGWYSHAVLKCPNDTQIADLVSLWMPDSAMILLRRDGRDVMKSRFSPFASATLAESTDVAQRRYAIAWYAHVWNMQIDMMRHVQTLHPRTVLNLKYEHGRQNGEVMIKLLIQYLGKPVLGEQIRGLNQKHRLEAMPQNTRGADKPRQTGEVGGYKRYFKDDETKLMTKIMRRNLTDIGYISPPAQFGRVPVKGYGTLPVARIQAEPVQSVEPAAPVILRRVIREDAMERRKRLYLIRLRRERRKAH
ncbi:sulfotransferase domain-containing protein [Asticcacaulis sp. YBE204]|uniref:sulfotransferase domain-containing protein n=1 Tax=Asticcacaulis sp. YBE204 TaxID=1282363 RepID=UPI0003C3E0E6|nr:sulfotransferase domain-containing protein [Asticcacaulis sp. YBE204]ESQ80748.1 hypothetical protein AEYBE204_00060 [Asticcacaulis sp. YBE204]